MTEAEANLKRCCGPEGCGGNSAGEPERYCIASTCMAWRWFATHVNNPDNPTGAMIRSTRTYGYCGIAGHWLEGLSGGKP